MRVRTYQSGDETVQAEIYNEAAGKLPGFKPAKPEEIARRYRAGSPPPEARLYALEGDRVVGYVVFDPNGRISYPWIRGDDPSIQTELLAAALDAMKRQGLPEAWAAYRADWLPVLDFFHEHGFPTAREMVNYVTELDRLPDRPVPDGCTITPFPGRQFGILRELGGPLFHPVLPDALEAFYALNPFIEPDSLFALRDHAGGSIRGVGLVLATSAFADPTQVDAAMPCFRLGAFGTERQRHKRINGMVSCAFRTAEDGEVLLAEGKRRLAAAGLVHAAAQCATDVPEVCAWYGRWFRRQGSFPIVARPLAAVRRDQGGAEPSRPATPEPDKSPAGRGPAR